MQLPPKVFLTEEQTLKAISEVDNFFIDINPVEYSPELFQGYKRIIITGPQRSGTTFTAKAIADTLNYKFVDEAEFGINNFNRFKSELSEDNIVIQAPAMSSMVHMAAGEDDLVVFMSRKWSDILKSVYKKNGRLSNWIFQDTMYELEKSHIQKVDPNINSVYDLIVDRNSYYLNCFYALWKEYFSKQIPNSIALNYESMNKHPMWVNKNLRSHFLIKQTSLL